MDDQHDDDDPVEDIRKVIADALGDSPLDRAGFAEALGQPWIDMQDTFKAIADEWEPTFDSIGLAAKNNTSSAVAEMVAALQPSATLLALPDLAEAFNFSTASMLDRYVAPFNLASTAALAEISGVSAILAQVREAAGKTVLAEYSKLADVFADWVPPESMLKSFEVPESRLRMPVLDFPVGNPLLETTIELAETNAEMHRRLEEITALNRGLLDEMAAMRQHQAEADLRHAESEKHARRWTKGEVVIAFVALVVAIAGLVLGILAL
ncbi:MAG: hypothetical protein JWN99_1052 [Ilumatobacteraceae bacterium]|nr:hypothetical protein [Ilumatobacteraceae bacterium]